MQWLRNQLLSMNLQGMIVTNPVNIKYLTNIQAEGTLLVTRKENIFITDGRYIEAVHNTLTLFDEIVVYEYNSNQEYLGTAYATDFNESIFKWSKSGSATVVVEEDGEGRMALHLKEFDDGKDFV